MTRKTPFYDAGLKLGAQMRELFGYWLPWEYGTGHIEEHNGTRQRTSLCDLDYMGEYTIEGPDALAFIQHVLISPTSLSEQYVTQPYATLTATWSTTAQSGAAANPRTCS